MLRKRSAKSALGPQCGLFVKYSPDLVRIQAKKSGFLGFPQHPKLRYIIFSLFPCIILISMYYVIVLIYFSNSIGLSPLRFEQWMMKFLDKHHSYQKESPEIRKFSSKTDIQFFIDCLTVKTELSTSSFSE